MPFAKKFRAMMAFPFAGDIMDGFTVESVDVRDMQGGSSGYIYAVQMVLCGPGGQQGVRRVLKKMFSSHPVTFSGYGNPYQLWFRKPTIESLGDKRYAVQCEGAGARVFIEEELNRFLAYLEETGCALPQTSPISRDTLVETYLQQYRATIKRKVDRYYSKLRAESDGQG